MSTATAPNSAPLPIRSKLAALRRSVSLWFCIDGLAVLCGAVVVLSLLSLLVDRIFRMDRPQRILSLAVGLVVLGIVAWRRLVRPLSRKLIDDALSLVVEAQHAELRQSLVGALQLSRLGDPESIGASPAMVQATIDAGARAAAGVEFRDTLDARRRTGNLLAILGAVALLGGICAIFPSTMGLWFSRNVLLSSRTWPQKTHLYIREATDGAIVCPRGDDLTVHVEADTEGVVPSFVTIRYRAPGGASGGEQMVTVGKAVFRTIFKNVLEPFRIRASGGDADTPWCEVRLVERPAVETLTLGYLPPPYIGTTRIALPSNIGPHPLPGGSSLVVEGTATKDLATATLAFGKLEPWACERVGARQFRIAVSGERLKSGAYAIALVDRAGYASKQPARFSLKVVPDRKPTVRAKLVGIGDLIVPRATIPIACRITDDHAVERAEIVYVRLVEGEDEPKPQRLPFGDAAKRSSRKEIAETHPLEAEPLKLDVGSHLTFRIEATDTDTVTGPKVGVSGTFSLRVVTEEELRADLLRREQEQRMEFERLLRDQLKLLENTKAGLASIKDKDTTALSAAEQRELAASEKRQRLVGSRCVAIAERFGSILDEVSNNKLEEGEAKIRVRLESRIIEPLGLLARRGVLQAADLLDVARRAAARPADEAVEGTPGRTALAEAARQQEQIVQIMRIILKNMVKWEGYQEAVTLLREVMKAQRQVSEQTIREYKRRIEKIFDQ